MPAPPPASGASAGGASVGVEVVPPDLRYADAPAAAVLRAAVSRGPIVRDAARKLTGLTLSAVNRHVTALLDAGMLRERPDLAAPTGLGRPGVPFEVDHDRYLTVGIHIGAVVTAIVASGLRGRIFDVVEMPTPRAGQDAAARAARAALTRSSHAGRVAEHCGSVWRSAVSIPSPAWSITPTWAGGVRKSAPPSQARSGCPSRCRRTSRRWQLRSYC